MRESAVEKYLVRRVKEAGGLCYKFKAPGRANVPDRIVLLPGRPVLFVEVKRPGEEPRPAQAREIARIRKLGQSATSVNSREAVDNFVAHYEAKHW